MSSTLLSMTIVDVASCQRQRTFCANGDEGAAGKHVVGSGIFIYIRSHQRRNIWNELTRLARLNIRIGRGWRHRPYKYIIHMAIGHKVADSREARTLRMQEQER
jgi:hypothetical protein